MDAASQNSRRDFASRILESWGLESHMREELLDKNENVLAVLSIYDSLYAIYEGDKDRASQWPARPNRAFEGRRPLDAMVSGDIERVAQYLRYHVYNA
ncbi:MbcA/ParS/Xre antitoxin family protein [Marinobacter nauticus]|uniref:Uncharacterized protein DUF2384 n=2 Tax=Marinobacter nauticus TaxID=2743 RepID=A0A368Y7B3_MARNT|nr:uncharacterized protein DUF2384 [Marinobacter nauticus]